MPQLREQMSTAVPQLYLQAESEALKAIAVSHGLTLSEIRVHRTFASVDAFIDGSAFVDRQVNISSIIKEMLKMSQAVVVIAVLPPALSFAQESSLVKEVADIGGVVALRNRDETFEQVVSESQSRVREPEFNFFHGESREIFASQEEIEALSSYGYTMDERRALRKAYREAEDSRSIVS